MTAAGQTVQTWPQTTTIQVLLLAHGLCMHACLHTSNGDRLIAKKLYTAFKINFGLQGV